MPSPERTTEAPSDQAILDAMDLAFANTEFRPLKTYDKAVTGSIRFRRSYDPSERCEVTVSEVYVRGPVDEKDTDFHALRLEWDNGRTYLVSLDSGNIYDVESQTTVQDISPKIVGVLAEVTEV